MMRLRLSSSASTSGRTASSRACSSDNAASGLECLRDKPKGNPDAGCVKQEVERVDGIVILVTLTLAKFFYFNKKRTIPDLWSHINYLNFTSGPIRRRACSDCSAPP